MAQNKCLMHIFYVYVFSYLISVSCLYKVSAMKAGKFFWLTLVTPVLGQYLLNKWKNKNRCLYIWTKNFSACSLNLNCLLLLWFWCLSLVFSFSLHTFLFSITCFYYFCFDAILYFQYSVKGLFKSCLLLDVLI